MNKRNLVVAVKESAYIERLADYIRHSAFGESWQLTAFTNAAALRGFIRGGYPVDLLAAQSAMLEEVGELPQTISTAAFVDFRGQSRHANELLQYQPLPQLLQAFTALYAAGGHALPKPALRGKGPAVAAVYSASGGTGKTTLAMQLARHASISGVQSFYLNLEQWNGSLASEDAAGGGDDFARLLYALQSEPGKGAAAVSALRRRHPALGMDMFMPCDNPDERLSLGAEQAKRLIAAIVDTGDYGFVVVDLDSRLDALHTAVFEACDTILWLVTPDAASGRKNELAMRYADRKFGQAFRDQQPKFRFVQKGSLPHRTDMQGGSSPRFDAQLPYVEEWAGGDHLNAAGAMVPHYRGAVDGLVRKLGIL
ncbi:AAA family ATPase [Paenibacillus sacheonensis]|uniref:AAA domain-containing protein n=1 Tax=Paenibacillus sacheonensis TaxID=742054 RepID=A0A7X5C0H7_9BACL|nr:AAA family ATPase [Paenibacillus sacheonensis]MBM7566944.1 Mrp family chromosome partitioning ATPase [Paenibacillus sacheonensis]NBC71566.1 hypothetical protein [Paenibacillus sacheonensis]